MCLKHVNAVIELYSDVKEDRETGSRSYFGAFDRLMVPENSEGKLVAPGFVAVVRFNFLGTADEEKKLENYIEQKRGCLEVKLLLSKCSDYEELRSAYPLGEFEIDLAKLEGSIKKACFHYLNYTHIINVGRLVLEPGAGVYVVKAVARWKPQAGMAQEESEFGVQAMYHLEICDASAQGSG